MGHTLSVAVKVMLMLMLLMMMKWPAERMQWGGKGGGEEAVSSAPIWRISPQSHSSFRGRISMVTTRHRSLTSFHSLFRVSGSLRRLHSSPFLFLPSLPFSSDGHFWPVTVFLARHHRHHQCPFDPWVHLSAASSLSFPFANRAKRVSMLSNKYTAFLLHLSFFPFWHSTFFFSLSASSESTSSVSLGAAAAAPSAEIIRQVLRLHWQ